MFVKKLTRQAVSEPDYPVARTRAGLLRGLVVDDTYIFRGVKYADAKRFRMPAPVKPWEGIRDAIVYGTACPEISTVMPNDNYNVPHVFYPQHEDCQYLNIWTRALDPGARMPVMVWLHGGGFSTGSGIEHFAYDGEELARLGGVVAVTLNHRLNALGYLDLSRYGDEYENSGNAGMADIVAALEWVRDNIASFGGDPDNVTIFGQSGGGGKVAALLQIPAADGLFHKAVIQSGMFPKDGRRKREDPVPAILDALGLTKDTAREIDTLPFWKIAQAVETLGPRAGMGFGPTQNDYYIGDAYDVGVSRHAKGVPVIIGNVLGEFANNFVRTVGDGRKAHWDEETRVAMVREAAGACADELMGAFRAAYPDHNVADAVFTDPMFRAGVLDYSLMRSREGACATYDYVFSLEMPVYGGTTPWHNAEIPYVFHNADYIEPSYIPGVTEYLQDIMCGAWTSFARTGKPQAAGMPEWHPFSCGDPRTMIFDRRVREVSGHDEQFLSILRREYPSFKLRSVDRGGPAGTFAGGPRTLEKFEQRVSPVPSYGE